MPWLLLLAVGAGAYFMRRRAPTTSVGRRLASSHLDPDLPVALQQEVERSMRYEQNPKSLSEFAESLSPSYPHAAYEIRVKAWVMGGRHGPVPRPPW
jgi:hypothetical protein